MNPKDRPDAGEILKMQVVKTLEDEILPDFFKSYSTKGKTEKSNMPHKLFMTKNAANLNPHLPPPTYEVTYKKYLKDYEEAILPDIKSTPAY